MKFKNRIFYVKEEVLHLFGIHDWLYNTLREDEEKNLRFCYICKLHQRKEKGIWINGWN